MVAVSDEGAWSVTTPLLGRNFTGSGDLTSSMFLAALLESGSVADAVGRTADVVYSVLERTTMLDQRELALVAGPGRPRRPRHHFEVTARTGCARPWAGSVVGQSKKTWMSAPSALRRFGRSS